VDLPELRLSAKLRFDWNTSLVLLKAPMSGCRQLTMLAMLTAVAELLCNNLLITLMTFMTNVEFHGNTRMAMARFAVAAVKAGAGAKIVNLFKFADRSDVANLAESVGVKVKYSGADDMVIIAVNKSKAMAAVQAALKAENDVIVAAEKNVDELTTFLT